MLSPIFLCNTVGTDDASLFVTFSSEFIKLLVDATGVIFKYWVAGASGYFDRTNTDAVLV